MERVVTETYNTLDNNLGVLANGLQNVIGNVNDVNLRVNDVSNEVKSLSTEIKEFMEENKMISIVSSAKQSIVLANQELSKKFSHYDDIRRQVLGIVTANDLNYIRKSSIASLTESNILKAPNYWLTRALIAISSWINNQKDIASEAIRQAMQIDDEKTSLLMSLVSLRAEKYNASLTWLDRYLSMQDPLKMENGIIPVINALATGVYTIDAQKLLLTKISAWEQELKNNKNAMNEVKDYWVDFFEESVSSSKVNTFNYQYLSSKSSSWSSVLEILKICDANKSIEDYLKEIINYQDNNSYYQTSQIDKIINDLVFNYDGEEKEIRKEITKNKIIIEENGNMNKANSRFDSIATFYEKNQSFYMQLSNIIQYENDPSIMQTQKIAVVLLKDIILDAYNIVINKFNKDNLPDISIEIGTWHGITKDGSNEQNLRSTLFMNIDSRISEIKEKFNYKYIAIALIFIAGCAFSYLFSLFFIILIIISLIWGFIEFNKERKIHNQCRQIVNSTKKTSLQILNNYLAEIGLYNNAVLENEERKTNVVNFLNSLNIYEYMEKPKDNKIRNIMGVNDGK